MQQRCRFCSRSLNSVQEVLDYYNDYHGFNKDNSSTFESYIDAIRRDAPQMFVEYCEYCNRPPLFDLRVKAEHYLRKHSNFYLLRLINCSSEKLVTGSWGLVLTSRVTVRFMISRTLVKH